MKINFIILSIILGTVLTGCKKEGSSDTDPSTFKYYVIADLGGTPFKAENNLKSECWSGPYEFCTTMINTAVNYIPIGDVFFFAGGTYKPQSNYLLSMKGKTYPFNVTDDNSPLFYLFFDLPGGTYKTSNVPHASRTGSVIITDVIADGETMEMDGLDNFGNPLHDKCFILKGTFTGSVAKFDSTDIKQITNGKFAIRFNETKRDE